MRQFDPHFEILSNAQKQLWPQLCRAPGLGFVLYGGTAVALRIGHRFSVDFDFFTHNQLDKEQLFDALPFIIKAKVIQEDPDTYTLLVPGHPAENEHVKVSFFGGIGFGRIGEPDQTRDGILQVASLDDLMATKLKVIFQRIEAKDYIDIAAMIDAGASLVKGLAAARMMYGRAFQPSESLKALVFFEGGDLHMLSSEVKETLIKASSRVRNLPNLESLSIELALPQNKRHPLYEV